MGTQGALEDLPEALEDVASVEEEVVEEDTVEEDTAEEDTAAVEEVPAEASAEEASEEVVDLVEVFASMVVVADSYYSPTY